MINNIEDFKYLEQEYNIPFHELFTIDLNLSGIAIDLNFSRIRFSLCLQNGKLLSFSVENDKSSFYEIKSNKLFFKGIFLFDVVDLQEDICEIFYTRKKGKVLCFNPNNRSSCSGCRFCYQAKSNDKQNISDGMLKNVFEVWLQHNNLKDLSHLEQVSVVTGCFKNESVAVDYLIKLREVLLLLGFKNEILFFGIISNILNIQRLAHIKPLQLCFTIECFENRDYFLREKKNLQLNQIKVLMQKSIDEGIKTTFSYIVGLDALDTFKENILLYKDCVNSFPIFSLFQTNKERIKYRNEEALNIEYYLQCRKYVETIFNTTDLLPNSWNNYRSLWRTCYNGKSI